MKKFTIVSLVFALVCWIVSGVSLAVFGEKGFENLSKEIVGRKLIEFQTKSEFLSADEIKKVEELEVMAPHSTVEISGSDDDGIHVQYPQSDKESFAGQIEGKKIRYDFSKYFDGGQSKFVVRVFNGNGIIQIGDADVGRLTFSVPKSIKTIKVKSESGDLKVYSLNGAGLKYESSSGSLKIRKSNFSKVEAVSVSGDLRVQGYTQKADLKTTSGEIKFQTDNSSPTLNASTTSGDITLDFAAEPDVKLSFDTLSGQVDIQSELKVDEKKKHKTYKLGDGKGEVKMKTVSGDLRVRTL